MKKNLHTKGFTLIELLVVIAIIAILTGIIVTNLTGSRSKARDAQRVSDLGNIQLALELYFDRCKQYPASINGVGANNNCPSGISLASYISQIPLPPTNPNLSSVSSYDYAVSSDLTNYVLHVSLENQTESAKNGLANLPSNISTSGAWTNPASGSAITTCGPATVGYDYCLGPK